jgi:hypothetical protein
MRDGSALVCLALVLAAACRREPAPRPALVAVSISVVPASGGSAEFEVHRDGAIRGGHLSGGAAPFVHQDEGRLDSLAVDSLWNLAAAIDSQTATASSPTGRGYVSLQLTFASGLPWLTSWPETARPVDPRLRATADWLMAHRVGGW